MIGKKRDYVTTPSPFKYESKKKVRKINYVIMIFFPLVWINISPLLIKKEVDIQTCKRNKP
jgi:hypothetical protein